MKPYISPLAFQQLLRFPYSFIYRVSTISIKPASGFHESINKHIIRDAKTDSVCSFHAKDVSARRTKQARAMKKEDQVYVLRLAKMARKHSR